MGIYSPNELSAEFMNVLKEEFIRNMSTNAYVDHVNHAVKLTVDENGVEGAAVTTVGSSR